MAEGASKFPKLVIKAIRIYKLDIPLKDIFTIATMSLDKAQNVLVEIVTSEGISGWGEASSLRSIVGETQRINIAAARELEQILVGKNPLAVNALVQEMDAYLPHNTTMKSAVDMALYDIAAQVAGLPLYLFLGGHPREMETDLTIGIGDPEEAGDKARAARSMGFRIIKVKLGLNFDEDYRRLMNIRKAVGREPVLRVDANQGWDRTSALRNLEAFKEFDIEFCEQPCRAQDHQGMRFVSHRSNIPIMADESLFSLHDALNLIEQDVAPYFNLKLTKSGGINNVRKIAHVAEAGDRPCMMGCMSESRLGITAAAHFAMSYPIVRFFDLDSFCEHAENPMVGGVEIKNGMITVPDLPGIGARPDPDYLKHLEEVKSC